MEQALVGAGQALLADPLHGGTAAVFMKGILQGAAGIIAHALKGGQGEGLLQVAQDECEQRPQGVLTPGAWGRLGKGTEGSDMAIP
jgi:hypothetical protein